MIRDVLTRHIGPKWREPEFHAAVLNGALILLVPTALAAYRDYTLEVARPFQPTRFSSAVRALPILLGLTPVALLVMWRSYVHAHAYRVKPLTVWRGPVESAAIAGGLALLVMVSGNGGDLEPRALPARRRVNRLLRRGHGAGRSRIGTRPGRDSAVGTPHRRVGFWQAAGVTG